MDIKQKIIEYSLISDEVVFIDGLTRVGKSMLNRLISSLDNVSHPQFLEPLEQLLPMFLTGHIDRNAFSAFMRLHLNERAYNYNLSRNLNFRYDDLTSIHNSKDIKSFYQQLSQPDGDLVLDSIKNSRTIHQFQTHDILTNYEYFISMSLNIKIIELFRNPIDTVHSWYIRGWGTRFDSQDPRSFTTLYEYEDKALPHYVLGYEKKYIKLNEMEKCVFLHNILLKKSLKQYSKLSDSEKADIILIKFEDVLSHPEQQMHNISKFLKSTITEHSKKAMQDARVPRIVNTKVRDDKYNEIKSLVGNELLDELSELNNDYMNSFYGFDV